MRAVRETCSPTQATCAPAPKGSLPLRDACVAAERQECRTGSDVKASSAGRHDRHCGSAMRLRERRRTYALAGWRRADSYLSSRPGLVRRSRATRHARPRRAVARRHRPHRSRRCEPRPRPRPRRSRTIALSNPVTVAARAVRGVAARATASDRAAARAGPLAAFCASR